MDNKIKMYCLTHKKVNFLEELSYNLVNISSKNISSKYLNCDTQDNIVNKEKYYAELTFHYWYWKNKLNIAEEQWIGFCQRRRFWTKSKIIENEIEKNKIKNNLLLEIPNELSKFESFLYCNPFSSIAFFKFCLNFSRTIGFTSALMLESFIFILKSL